MSEEIKDKVIETKNDFESVIAKNNGNKKRTKRVDCLSMFDLNKLSYRELKSTAIEKGIKTNLRS